MVGHVDIVDGTLAGAELLLFGTLPLLHPTCFTLAKLLNYCVPQFSHL